MTGPEVTVPREERVCMLSTHAWNVFRDSPATHMAFPAVNCMVTRITEYVRWPTTLMLRFYFQWRNACLLSLASWCFSIYPVLVAIETGQRAGILVKQLKEAAVHWLFVRFWVSSLVPSGLYRQRKILGLKHTQEDASASVKIPASSFHKCEL